MKNNHESLVREYLEERKNYESLFFYHIESFFQTPAIDKRRVSLKEAKTCLKFLENQKDQDWKFYKNYIEDIEKSMFFKRDLLNDNHIAQTDITTFDNSIFDVYKGLIKKEKTGLVEIKNKQLFEVV